MSLDKLNDKQFTLGQYGLPKIKDVAKKTNEIIDYLNIKDGFEVILLVSQSSTNNPTVYELRNLEKVSITAARSDVGSYTITHNVDMNLYYPVVTIQNNYSKATFGGELYEYNIIPSISGNIIFLTAVDTETALLSDNCMGNTPIKITFYKFPELL
jgi:hypothetical protein